MVYNDPCILFLIVQFFKINKYDKIYSSILKFIRYKFKDNNEFNTAIVLWFNRKMTIKKFVPSYYVNAYKMEENKYGDISLWDTINVTNMSYIFYNRYFNQNINMWNIDNVNDMKYMFYDCKHFDKHLESWNLLNVKNVDCMFNNSQKYYSKLYIKQHYDNKLRLKLCLLNMFINKLRMYEPGIIPIIEKCNSHLFKSVEELKNAVKIWYRLKYIDKYELALQKFRYGHIYYWNTKYITNMDSLFKDMTYFNDNIEIWDVSNVLSFSNMFSNCETFNQPLNKWNVSNVKNMCNMFYRCKMFNQSLNNWNVEKLIISQNMFTKCISFNHRLDNWNINKLKIAKNMFSECYNYTNSSYILDKWDLSNVNNTDMFYRCNYNRVSYNYLDNI